MADGYIIICVLSLCLDVRAVQFDKALYGVLSKSLAVVVLQCIETCVYKCVCVCVSCSRLM